MDFIFDLITMPFEMMFNSLECLFGCVFFMAIACCALTIVWLFVLS